MPNTYWIGGSSCSGKSTCAGRLATKHGLELVRTDDLCFGKLMFDHPDLGPFPAIRHYRDSLLAGMDSFSRTDVAESLRAFVSYCDEVFALLLNEIEPRKGDKGLVVEGAHVLPHLAARHLPNSPVVFLTSSKEHQRVLWKREMAGEVPGGHPAEIEGYRNCENQALVEHTRVEFHHRLALYIEETAAATPFKTLHSGGETTIDGLVTQIEEHWGLSPRRTP